eukprot:gene2365-biopygen7169
MSTNRKDPPAKRRQAALATLAAHPPADLCAYTDGSARGGVSHGGSGWHICTPAGAALLSDYCAAGRHCSSYRGEGVALLNALRDLRACLVHPRGRHPHLQMPLTGQRPGRPPRRPRRQAPAT